MARKLRIAIDCRIPDPRQGIGTAVLALAKAFSDSGILDQEYTFIVREGTRDWLTPYVYGPCKLEGIPESALTGVKAALREIAPLRSVWKKLRSQTTRVPISDGYVEGGQFDVVHFPTQAGYLTEKPSIYQPWDLQHLHYPNFFSKAEFEGRERMYRAFCAQASYVCVQAEWTKQDIITKYNLPSDKVVVIPWGSVFEAYKIPSQEEVRACTNKYGLPSRYFVYPAITWPHKNHEIIIRALSILKTRHGFAPSVFFTGSATAHRSLLEKLAKDLSVSEQLHFPGFVSSTELQVILKTATAMIFPSRFEGFGLPILEAFHAGLPVLCSNATTLPEVACDGALYFDPDSAQELAALIEKVSESSELRCDLIKRGRLVLSRSSIQNTARALQSLYSRTAATSLRNHRTSGQIHQARREA
jgi:glycosyltransferase involved in cell wall biosynthesis